MESQRQQQEEQEEQQEQEQEEVKMTSKKQNKNNANTIFSPTPTCLISRFPDNKVHHIDIHPVKPWVLFANRTGQIHLYDYEQNDVLHSFSLNSMYESKREEALLLKVLEKNYNNISLPDWYDEQLLQPQKPGELKSVKLYDDDVIHWKLNEREHDSQLIVSERYNKQFERVGRSLNLSGSVDTPISSPISAGGNSFSKIKPYIPSKKPKCIVLHTESRVIMLRYDEMSSSVYFFDEVRNTQLDKQNIQSIEFLYTHPIIALGLSDGTIRLWNYKTKEVSNKIVSTQSKVLKMIAIHKDDSLNTYPSLLVSHDNGTINMWNLDTGKPEFSIPKTQSAINDMIIDWDKGHIITIGSDKSIFVRKLSTGETVSTVKLKGDKSLNCIAKITTCNCIPSWFIMLPKSSHKLSQISADLNEQTYSNAFDVLQFLPYKKNAKKDKIYTIVQHQLHPGMIFIGTNFGLMSFVMDYDRLPAIVTGVNRELPASHSSNSTMSIATQSHTEEFEDKNRRVVYYMKQQAIFRRVVIVRDNVECYNEPVKVLSLPRVANLQLGLSYSGQYLSVVWEREKEYEIYSTVSWKKLASGINTTSLVWSFHEDKFAISQGPHSIKQVSIFIVADDNVQMVNERAGTTFPLITTLFGGVLLGVLYDGQSNDLSFQFLDWNGHATKGTYLPKPRIVEWDPLSSKCVMVYEDSYAVFSFLPDFRMQCYVKEKVEAAKWWNSTLFLATESEIKCLFPTRKQLYSVVLASFDIAHYAGMTRSSDDDSLDPIPQLRPKGTLSFLDVVGDSLYVADTNYILHSLSLDTPSLKFRFLVAANLVERAMLWIPYIAQELHDYCADFLVDHDYPDYACRIETMSPSKRFQLCIEYGLIESAFAVLAQIDSDRMIHNLSEKDLAKLYIRLASTGENQVDNLLKASYPVSMKEMTEIFEKSYKRATELDPSSFVHLIVFYTKHGDSTKLQDLRQHILEKKQQTQSVIDWDNLLNMITLFI